MTCETCDQLRTLYERERAKNAKMEKVVEAAKKAAEILDCGCTCHSYECHCDGYANSSARMVLGEALSELEAK